MATVLKGKRKEILASWIFLIVGLVSLSTATFAWFSSSRNVQVSYQTVQVAGPDDAVIYQYKGNYTTLSSNKVYGGWNYANRASRSFTSLSEDFEAVDVLSFSNFTPRAAYTFAFEMSKGANPNVAVMLSSFSCALYSLRADASKIYLSEAIDIYTSAYYYTDSGDDTLTAVATAHFHNTNLTDQFVQNGASASAITLFDQPYLESKMLIFMSIVCSDDPSTYYDYDDTTSVYSKDSANGNSNAFKNLDITFDLFSLEGVGA
jgi:hypothetical protein